MGRARATGSTGQAAGSGKVTGAQEARRGDVQDGLVPGGRARDAGQEAVRALNRAFVRERRNVRGKAGGVGLGTGSGGGRPLGEPTGDVGGAEMADQLRGLGLGGLGRLTSYTLWRAQASTTYQRPW